MKERVIIIGGGINGLVAANFLQRSGFQVTLLERKPSVGGACTFETLVHGSNRYEYPTGAPVLGFMQDFVFSQTGLADRLAVHAPVHPTIVYFESKDEPCLLYGDVDRLNSETGQRWGEHGNLDAYFSDLERVRSFLIEGYRHAQVPTLEMAAKSLGGETANRWIAGSARDLMNHYFTSDAMKIAHCFDVTESGPVSIDAPYSAFTIPLMSSGSVFGGRWGFVKGGLWKATQELAAIDKEIGVELVTAAAVENVSQADHSVTYRAADREVTIAADSLVFATDPLTAAKLLNNGELTRSVAAKKALGTSGKLVLLFDRPVIWKDRTGLPDVDLAFRFIFAVDTPDELESTTQDVVSGQKDFVPGYYEIYCEGAGMRRLGLDRGYDSLTVLFKNLSFDRPGEQLEHVKSAVEATILSRIENPDDLVTSILLTPRDLHDRFYFPQGNIDHIELAADQTFFARTYSPNPDASFYQFGSDPRIKYCAAGAYPCGSVAGTPGYMCAMEMVREHRGSAVIWARRQQSCRKIF